MATKESKTLEQLEAEYESAKKALKTARELEAKKAAEEAERKRVALAAEKDKRHKEVNDAINRAIELLKAYNEDYGSYSITDHFNDLSFLLGGKPWRLFF